MSKLSKSLVVLAVGFGGMLAGYAIKQKIDEEELGGAVDDALDTLSNEVNIRKVYEKKLSDLGVDTDELLKLHGMDDTIQWDGDVFGMRSPHRRQRNWERFRGEGWGFHAAGECKSSDSGCRCSHEGSEGHSCCTGDPFRSMKDIGDLDDVDEEDDVTDFDTMADADTDDTDDTENAADSSINIQVIRKEKGNGESFDTFMCGAHHISECKACEYKEVCPVHRKSTLGK